jgi:uncharacterized Zn-binding protein involved in type VI secretion
MPAARVTDLHKCAITGPFPGGPIIPPCAITVFTGSMIQARMTDLVACIPPPGPPIVKGSLTVFVVSLPAARILDPTACGGVIATGFPTVLIGG